MVWPFNKGDPVKEDDRSSTSVEDLEPSPVQGKLSGKNDDAGDAEEEELKKIFQQLADEETLQQQDIHNKPEYQAKKSSSFKPGIDDDESYPTQMSCVQAFEELMKCYSFTGQIRNYYRYGDIRNCADRRSQMKFCLYTKFVPKKRRPNVIQEWYRQRQREIATTYGSSQDVWNLRRQKLDNPFLENWNHLHEDKDSGDRV